MHHEHFWSQILVQSRLSFLLVISTTHCSIKSGICGYQVSLEQLWGGQVCQALPLLMVQYRLYISGKVGLHVGRPGCLRGRVSPGPPSLLPHPATCAPSVFTHQDNTGAHNTSDIFHSLCPQIMAGCHCYFETIPVLSETQHWTDRFFQSNFRETRNTFSGL